MERDKLAGKLGVKAMETILSPHKLAMRARLEKRVRERRAELLAAARERKGVADILSDMVAEEVAMRQDATPPPGRRDAAARRPDDSSSPVTRRRRRPDGYDSASDEDEDARLTESERIAILLHLEQTLYAAAVAEGAWPAVSVMCSM